MGNPLHSSLTTVVVILLGPSQWGKPVLLTTVDKRLANLISRPIRDHTPSPMLDCSDCHSLWKGLPLSTGFYMVDMKIHWLFRFYFKKNFCTRAKSVIIKQPVVTIFFQGLSKCLNSPPPKFTHFPGSLHPVTEQGGVIKAHSFWLEAGNSDKLYLLVPNRVSWDCVKNKSQFD